MRVKYASTVGRILVIFGTEECVCYRLVPGEYEYSSSKTTGPSVGLHKQNYDLKKDSASDSY
jgi:hypothetical protein